MSMTPEQEETYRRFCDAGWEYSHTQADRSVFLERWERGAEYARLLETRVIAPDGTHYALPLLTARFS